MLTDLIQTAADLTTDVGAQLQLTAMVEILKGWFGW